MIGKSTTDYYAIMKKKFDEAARKIRRQSTGGPSPARLSIAQNGRFFTRLILSAFSQEMITASNVSDFLGIKLKHLPAIEKEVWR